MYATGAYMQFLRELADAHARHYVETSKPEQRNDPEYEARIRAERLHFYREDFAKWKALGDHYADVLEDEKTSAILYNTIGDELDEIVERAGLHITSPEVLRLLFPLLRFRQAERQRGVIARSAPAGDPGDDQGDDPDDDPDPPQESESLKESVLKRLQERMKTPLDYQPISVKRARELAEKILNQDDDATVWAFITLLHGITAAHLGKDDGKHDVEGLVIYAVHLGYSLTQHFNFALEEFASLDPDHPDDQRVLERRFTDEE